ncbi:MAG: hypothetical protein ACLP9C_05800 [Acidimicrobiales bacterium]
MTLSLVGCEPDGKDRGGRAPADDATVPVVAWPDPVVDSIGLDPRSAYVERFWLPVLGPSATLLVRHLAERLERAPGGFDLDLDATARSLGLGGSGGRHSPFRRSILRCCRYGLARHTGPGALAVRRWVAPLTADQVRRLPADLRDAHRRWASSPQGLPADRLRVRGRLLALDLLAAGAEPGRVEAHLLGAGLHPAIAHECSSWAKRRLGR